MGRVLRLMDRGLSAAFFCIIFVAQGKGNLQHASPYVNVTSTRSLFPSLLSRATRHAKLRAQGPSLHARVYACHPARCLFSERVRDIRYAYGKGVRLGCVERCRSVTQAKFRILTREARRPVSPKLGVHARNAFPLRWGDVDTRARVSYVHRCASRHAGYSHV